MEERKEEGEEEIQEHGPERWLPKWERQCQAQEEQDQQLSPELQEAAAAAKPEHKLHQLWHLFQDSATAVAQLYKDPVCQQPAFSLCSLSKCNCRRLQPLQENVETHQRSFDFGVQIAISEAMRVRWLGIKNAEEPDFLSFLGGKLPPTPNSRAPQD